MRYRERVTSWFRRKVLPGSSENVMIDEREEKPWREELMRHWNDSTFHRESPIDPMTKETAELRQTYRTMLAEPTVKAALLGKLGSVASQPLRVNPPVGFGKDPFAREIAEFVQWNLIGPSGTGLEVIWEISHGAALDGFSVCEKIPKLIESGPYRMKWGLEKLKAKDTKQIQIETDKFRNVVGLYNFRGSQGALPYDPKDFVIFSYLPFFQNPHGMSDFRASSRAVELIVSALKARTLTLAKNTGPYLVGKIKNNQLRQQVAENLKAARANGYIVVSDATEIEVLDLASRGTTEFQSAIDDLRKEVAIGIQGAFLQMLEGTGADLRGNSLVQKDTSEIFAWLFAAGVTGTINSQIVPDLVIPNYGPDAPIPVCQLGAINPDDILRDMAIDKLANDMGVDLSLEDFLTRINRKGPNGPNDILKGRSGVVPGITLPGNQPGGVFAEDLAAEVPAVAAVEPGNAPAVEDAEKKKLTPPA